MPITAETRPTPIPTRHPAGPRSAPAGVEAIARLLRLPTLGPEQFRRYGELLTVGDAPMDALVAWMHTDAPPEAREMFERALEHGISQVADAPAPLREFFDAVETVPDWVDFDRIDLGAAALRSGGSDGLAIARDVALFGGYLFSGFNQTLLRTGALEKGSNRRFAETSQWALDVMTPGGLRPGGIGYRSTLRVRLIHSMVRRHVSAMEDWDPGAFGLPVNQTDMAATLVGALIAPTTAGLGMGMALNPREYSAVALHCRWVGTLMGVADDLLPTGYLDGVRILAQTSQVLAVRDETSPILARPMISDPLSWNFDHLPTLRRRIAQSQHRSVSTAFLGRRAMRQLGTRPSLVPWYPMLRLPVNLVRSALAQLPGGRERAAARGARENAAFMRMLLTDEATIGESARHVTT